MPSAISGCNRFISSGSGGKEEKACNARDAGNVPSQARPRIGMTHMQSGNGTLIPVHQRCTWTSHVGFDSTGDGECASKVIQGIYPSANHNAKPIDGIQIP